MPQAAPAFSHSGGQEEAADRQKERDGQPGQNVGDEIVGLGADSEQRAGVDRHHQEGDGDAEQVQSAVLGPISPGGAHSASLQMVTTAPLLLFPDHWHRVFPGRRRGRSSRLSRETVYSSKERPRSWKRRWGPDSG